MLLLIGSASMTICLTVIGLAFHTGNTSGPLLLIFILLYVASFAVSLGAVALGSSIRNLPEPNSRKSRGHWNYDALDSGLRGFPVVSAYASYRRSGDDLLAIRSHVLDHGWLSPGVRFPKRKANRWRKSRLCGQQNKDGPFPDYRTILRRLHSHPLPVCLII